MSNSRPENPSAHNYLQVPQNRFGVWGLEGEAIDKGLITNENVEKYFAKLIPLLEKGDCFVSADRTIIIDEKDFEMLQDGPKAYVYLPAGVQGNYKEDPMPPPTTEYEDRRWSLNRNALRTITGER